MTPAIEPESLRAEATGDQMTALRMLRIVLAWAVAVAVVWTTAALVSHSVLLEGRDVGPGVSPTVQALSGWDGSHYADVAEDGYSVEGVERRHLAFFPLLPAVSRLLGGRDDVRLAGILVSQICLLIALLVLVRLRPAEPGESGFPLREEPAFWVLVSPLALFFYVYYTESIFFLLSILAYWGLREQKWLLSGTSGLLAGLCRPTAVLLAVIFLGHALASRRRGGRWRPPLALAAAPVLGVAAYMGFAGYLVGDPLGYFEVQASFWEHEWTVPFAPVARDAVRFVADLAQGDFRPPDQTVRLLSASGVLMLLVWGKDRLDPALVAYVAVSLLVIHAQEPHRSTARYELVLFPVYLLLPRSPLGRRHLAPIVAPALVVCSSPASVDSAALGIQAASCRFRS